MRTAAAVLPLFASTLLAQGPPVTGDWLVDEIERAAEVFRASERELILDNGLIRRVFRTEPDGATVAFDNLMTGASIVRAVRPEARLSIDGVAFDVGGLRGQPNHAYLRSEWLDAMTEVPGAFHYVGHEIGRPEPSVQWAQVRRHGKHVQWPPGGVHLRMDYRLGEDAARRLMDKPQDSDFGRSRLVVDEFGTLDAGWKLHVSDAHPRSSFSNEGKVAEIYTPANTAVYAERKLPTGTRVVELRLDVGTDRSASWGPGLALVWKDRTVKFHLRPGGNAYDQVAMFGTFDGSRENAAAGGRQELDVSKPWTLRLRLSDDAVHCEARQPGEAWRSVQVIPLGGPAGDPLAVRIGKLDRSGGGGDFSEPGQLGRCRLLRFAAFGAIDAAGLRSVAARVEQLRRITVSVHYELYEGLPLLCKWLTVQNGGDGTVTVDSFTSEILAAVEGESRVEPFRTAPRLPELHVETDYAFASMTATDGTSHCVHWVTDPDYRTQVNYLRKTPCLLEVRPTYGPSQDVAAGATFETFRTWILVHDSSDRVRQALGQRRMYRTIAPWVTENPLMMHVRSSKPDAVKLAIDQCAEVGFEMVILTFGSGFHIENEDPQYLEQWREIADYAREKGVEIGGYSLLSSRRIKPDSDNCINPATGKPGGQIHGGSPALASRWGQDYFRKLYQFYEKTGFRLLEHDGSYPGNLDAAARPPLQKGVDDSRWVQWRIITDFYRWCRQRGVYLNVPDWYYLAGSNKCGMGYREVNWSLPRAQQVIHTRQNIFDGTWEKTPSMGWMFVPLTQYHGGGAAATIEPLHRHRDHYERMLASNLGWGVQACYRGPRLFDTDATRKLVQRQVAWFKTYRDILESDVIHSSSRRADGRDLDWVLHAGPRLEHKGMLVVFNPLEREVTKTLRLGLYYTGLTEIARVRENGGEAMRYELDRRFRIDLPVTVPAGGSTFYVIE